MNSGAFRQGKQLAKGQKSTPLKRLFFSPPPSARQEKWVQLLLLQAEYEVKKPPCFLAFFAIPHSLHQGFGAPNWRARRPENPLFSRVGKLF
jgi:hypothetical protein